MGRWDNFNRKALYQSDGKNPWVSGVDVPFVPNDIDIDMWVCLKIVYPKTQWFCWSLSLLNGYFIGNINPTFSDKPMWLMDQLAAGHRPQGCATTFPLSKARKDPAVPRTDSSRPGPSKASRLAECTEAKLSLGKDNKITPITRVCDIYIYWFV